jgi:aminobenzoyl-glutamate utilization protein A
MVPEARYTVPADEQLDAAYARALADGARPDVLERMKGGVTAVVGILKGSMPGPTVAFRFDMDAVPVQETDDPKHLPNMNNFRSHYPGVMHSCAHDAHTAIGLTLASKMADRNFAGVLKLIFQPAEEGVGGGARSIAEKGLVDDVSMIYCCHLTAGVEPGIIVGNMNYLATTKMEAVFHGKAAHAAGSPEKGRNALLGAASALLNIHAIPPYSKNETRVNVGILQGGTASNVVPDKARMVIETRAVTTKVNEELVERVKAIVKGSAEMHQLGHEIKIIGSAGSIIGDEKAVEIAFDAAKSLGYHTYIKEYDAPGSEDASFLIQRVQECGGKGTYLAVGSRIPNPHHSANFDIDEVALPRLTDLLWQVAMKILG